MRIVIVCFWLILLAGGCSNNSSQAINCPDRPKQELYSSEIEFIKLGTQIVKKNRKFSSSRRYGYSFHSVANQTLKITKSDNLCLWIYTPDLQRKLINSSIILSKTGKYILHVEGKKSDDYSIEISLSSLKSNKDSQHKNQINFNVETEVSQDRAVKIIKNWLNDKHKIFAPPYDKALAKHYTTGEFYTNKTLPAIDFLQQNQQYYQYQKSEIKKVISFSKSKQQYILVVDVIENSLIRNYSKIIKDPPEKTYRIIYTLIKNGDLWKISKQQIEAKKN